MTQRIDDEGYPYCEHDCDGSAPRFDADLRCLTRECGHCQKEISVVCCGDNCPRDAVITDDDGAAYCKHCALRLAAADRAERLSLMPPSQVSYLERWSSLIASGASPGVAFEVLTSNDRILMLIVDPLRTAGAR